MEEERKKITIEQTEYSVVREQNCHKCSNQLYRMFPCLNITHQTKCPQFIFVFFLSPPSATTND